MLFEKIPTTHEQFKITKKEYMKVYEDFKHFAEQLTNSAGNVKTSSNKPRSYANHLIRLFIFLKRQHISTIGGNFETVIHLENLMKHPSFSSYNQQEVRFPSATITCFRAYVTERAMVIEDAIDNEANAAYLTAKQLPIIKEEQLIYVPTKRKEKVISKFGHTYVRSQAESFIAKQRSNYTCEMSDSHITFLTEHHQKPYVESHHLIPMAAQDYFDYTIDFAHNIVTLCPTCHRKIHYAQPEQKKEMLQFLFEKRKNHYATYGISITEDVLFSFYKIM
ncbi:MAG: HNH endonuclease [Caryophanon sp.]|nr:HNH endonuclease [Caryophanon sp.]